MSIMLHITYNYALQTLCGAPHNVCNDNGIAENLPLNRMLGDYDIIHGTFFICGLTRDDFTDLTPKQMKHYEEMYHDPQLFFLLGNLLLNRLTRPDFIAYNHKHADKWGFRICRKLYRSFCAAWTIRSEEEWKQAGRWFDVPIFEGYIPQSKA